MKLSWNLIKNFVDLPEDLSAQEISDKITLAIAEVDGVEPVGDFFRQVKVAQIQSIRPHPEADKLNLVIVDFGAEPLEVICGATNVRVGLKVAFAPLGVTLPEGLKLEAKKIRGIVSQGMLCSEKELGLSSESQGIMELEEAAVIGQDMLEYLDKEEDLLIEIDNKSLTHRPDLWGHYGFAREVAAVLRKPLKNPFTKNWQESLKGQANSEKAPLKIEIQSGSSAKSYFGLSVNNVEIQESPRWMQDVLKKVGLRPINNLVDISNYVMIELGMPLHIFDRSKIAGDQLNIRPVGQEISFQTLDEVERELLPSDTIIADADKPLVLAGVMGGLNSGVDSNTQNIFIEVANWEATKVRQTSARLGLRTDSSSRYEKSLDSQLCERTLYRTLELILEFCPQAQVVGSVQYAGEDLDQFQALKLQTNPAKINQVLGTALRDEQIREIFEALDFKVTEQWQVTVPSYRSTKDIENEADLIEEIGRMIGYDTITARPPGVELTPPMMPVARIFENKLKDFLVLHGQSLEVMSYPLVGEALLKKAQWPELNEKLKLKNALSAEANRMRPSLVPSLLEKLALNQKNFSSFRLFELGRSFLSHEKNFSEERSQLGMIFYHHKENPFMQLVNLAEKMLAFMQVPFQLEVNQERFKNTVLARDWSGCHPHEYYHVKVRGRFQGAITSLHPMLLRQWKVKGQAALLVWDYTELLQATLRIKTSYQPLPQFPTSIFDLTVITDPHEPVANVLAPLQKLKIKELIETKIVGVFRELDKPKAVTLRAVFFDTDKTLEKEVLEKGQQQVVQALEKAGYPLKPI